MMMMKRIHPRNRWKNSSSSSSFPRQSRAFRALGDDDRDNYSSVNVTNMNLKARLSTVGTLFGINVQRVIKEFCYILKSKLSRAMR